MFSSAEHFWSLTLHLHRRGVSRSKTLGGIVVCWLLRKDGVRGVLVSIGSLGFAVSPVLLRSAVTYIHCRFSFSCSPCTACTPYNSPASFSPVVISSTVEAVLVHSPIRRYFLGALGEGWGGQTKTTRNKDFGGSSRSSSSLVEELRRSDTKTPQTTGVAPTTSNDRRQTSTWVEAGTPKEQSRRYRVCRLLRRLRSKYWASVQLRLLVPVSPCLVACYIAYLSATIAVYPLFCALFVRYQTSLPLTPLVDTRLILFFWSRICFRDFPLLHEL